jgi:sugar lactone lactonase YvrE
MATPGFFSIAVPLVQLPPMQVGDSAQAQEDIQNGPYYCDRTGNRMKISRKQATIFLSIAALLFFVVFLYVAIVPVHTHDVSVQALAAAVSQSTAFSARANQAVSMSMTVPALCTSPCSIGLTFTLLAGTPMLQIYVGSDNTPVVTTLISSSPYYTELAEASGVFSGRCTSSCTIRCVLQDGASGIAGMLAVNSSALLGPASPSTTGSPTPTVSATPSATLSESESATASSSESSSGTYSPSCSESWSSTMTSTPSGTPTGTWSGSTTPSYSGTPTASLSTGASSSETITSSISPSFSSSMTASASFSAASTPSRTESLAPTHTRTASGTVSSSRTMSKSVSASSTPSRTASTTPEPLLQGFITTFVGQSTAGFVDGTGTEAKFERPSGLVMDSAGSIYITDGYVNNAIRKVSSAGVVSTFAGNGQAGLVDGQGTDSRLYSPAALCIDSNDLMYVSDTKNNVIRTLTTEGVIMRFVGQPSSGFVDGTGSEALFNTPTGIGIGADANIYVSDTSNNVIRQITPGGIVTWFAGRKAPGLLDGTGTSAMFGTPFGLAFDSTGNVFYIADVLNNAIRKVTLSRVVTTLAGRTLGYADGIGSNARFYYPVAVCVDRRNDVYVSDAQNAVIRRIAPNGNVTTFLGVVGDDRLVDGSAETARLGGTASMLLMPGGQTMYVLDAGVNALRIIT